jgi:glycerol-1-phosphate dehydrogenase [NAD(P)+]
MTKHVHDLDEYLNFSVSALAGTVFKCPQCGRNHCTPVEKISIGNDLIDGLPELLSEVLGHPPHKPTLIYDQAIEEIICDFVIKKIPQMNFHLAGLGKKNQLLEPEAILGDQVAEKLAHTTDILIGAGSGVIADLTKWIATKTGLPFILYGTAPSMNAHASITSTMTIDGVKTSVLLDPAKAILFDVPVLASAPKIMLQAGLGDLTARTICNADWKLGQLIRNGYFCPVPYHLTGKYEPALFQEIASEGIQASSTIEKLGEAILVSGLSMTILDGDTSPSSGTEHVFSHYWDLQVELENAPKNLHGIQVGVAIHLSYAFFDILRNLDVSGFDPERIRQKRPALDQILAENNAKFGDKAHLFNRVVHSKWIPDHQFTSYIENILANWENIWASMEPYIGNRTAVDAVLEQAGFHSSLDLIGRTPQQVRDAILYGNRYRSRYTILDLAWELGLIPDLTDEVLARSGLLP